MGELLTEAQAEIKTLREQVRLLEQAKDAEDVNEIRRNFSTDYEQYETLVNDATRCLEQLGSTTIVRCIYGAVSGNDWYPSQEVWGNLHIEIERLIHSQRIRTDDKNNPSQLWANQQHPGNHQAFAAVEALDRFLSQQRSQPLGKQLEQELGMPVNLSNREYWETVLLEGSRLPD